MSTQISPLSTLNRYLSTHRSQLAAALPRHLNPDRMARLAMTSFSQNKALAKCTPQSIFASVIVASQLGLEIGVAGQGYLVPYKQTCTFVPGWQGYVDLVSRSGRGSVWTGAVFEGDEFEYALGSDPFVKHRPSGESNPKMLKYTYAIGRVKDSEWPIIEVWPIERIWAHRDKHNKVGGDHYSFKHPEMYARKVPLMQVIKYMPKSIELATAMEIDAAAGQGRGAEYIDGEFVVVDTEEPEAVPANEPRASDLDVKKPSHSAADKRASAQASEPEGAARGIFGGE